MMVIDFKTGKFKAPWHCIQVAAYMELIRINPGMKAVKGFDYNEKTRVGKFNGIPVPSVTQIVGGIIDKRFYSPELRDRGIYIHQCIHLAFQGKLNRKKVEKLHPEVIPCLRAFDKFVEDQPDYEMKSETRLFHPVFQYHGGIDLLVDNKTPDVSGAVVYLKDDGEYSTEPVEFKKEVQKFTTLLAAYNIGLKSFEYMESEPFRECRGLLREVIDSHNAIEFHDRAAKFLEVDHET